MQRLRAQYMMIVTYRQIQPFSYHDHEFLAHGQEVDRLLGDF